MNYLLDEEDIPVEKLQNYSVLKAKIYEDLWHKGYYITDGEKFGGDFLLYPGNFITCTIVVYKFIILTFMMLIYMI